MGKRILLLSDDPDIRDLLHLILRGAGHDVQSVESLSAVRASMGRAPRPHLLLLDLMLPDGEALALCREVRQGAPEVPIAVLTAYLPPDVRGEAISAGCGYFLGKPFDPESVESLVRDALAPLPSGRRRAATRLAGSG